MIEPSGPVQLTHIAGIPHIFETRNDVMSWTSPFSLPGSWYKGNLHTHTTQSDGLATPQEAIAWYRGRGYDFLALTDHWVYTPGEVIEPSFVTLSGAELHGDGYHMLAIGLAGLPDRQLDRTPAALARAVAELGGLAFYAHPYWTGQTSEHIEAHPGVRGIEVYNAVCDHAYGLGYSRVQWDELLERGERLVGLAVDDVHWKYGAEGWGFVMVRSPRLDEAHLVEALRQGHFYSSTGPALLDLRVVPLADGAPALCVRCSPCRAITFYGAGPSGHRFKGEAGQPLDGAIYPVASKQVYLRVECQDAEGRVAWSNPLFVSDML